MLAAMALLAAALASFRAPPGSRWYLVGAQALTLSMLMFLLPQHWLDLRISDYKGLSQTMQVVDTEVRQVAFSPLGFLTVVESPTIPFRHAPGLSFAARVAPPEQLAVFTDSDDMSVITRFDGDVAPIDYVGDVTSALPYQVLDQPKVAVLGAGGGAGVLQALYHGAAHVDAVELNPQVIGLVRDTYGEFSGHLYDDERVTVHVDEARGFVRRREARYDLIQVALLDSFATSGSGAQGLSESYLYTVEAVQEYLEHLTTNGVLAITRWLKLPPRDSLKLVATAIEALKRQAAASPGHHLAMLRSWNTVTLIVSREELSADRIAAIRAFAKSRSFDTAWYPGMGPEEANRYNLLDEPALFNGTAALLSADAAGFIEDYKFDITPATDDRPYFFHFFKWSVLPEMISLARRGGAGLIEWGYLVLTATVVQAVLAGLLLILLPLRAVQRDWDKGVGMRMGSYFFLLGLAFLFVEIAFIQKFILFLSHPLYSVAVVLSGFLVFAGIGSALSEHLVARVAGARFAPVTIAVFGIALVALSYVWLLPVLFQQWLGLTNALKILLSIVLIAPLAVCMGMPFPIGLKAVGSVAPAFIPWAWGINGFASVVSATLATLLAIQFGFNVVLLAAIVLYLCAALIIDARR